MSAIPNDVDPNAEKPTVVIPMFCRRHGHDLIVRRMKLRESDPWLVYDITARMLLFNWAVTDPRIFARTDGDTNAMSLVLGEIGCLACWSREGYRRAILVLRKGIDHAAQVGQNKKDDADWPVKERGAALPPRAPAEPKQPYAVSEEQRERLCRPGRGADTCKFLTFGGDEGWCCAKGTSLEPMILARTLNAKGENCSGPPSFEPKGGAS